MFFYQENTFYVEGFSMLVSTTSKLNFFCIDSTQSVILVWCCHIHWSIDPNKYSFSGRRRSSSDTPTMKPPGSPYDSCLTVAEPMIIIIFRLNIGRSMIFGYCSKTFDDIDEKEIHNLF